MEYDAGEIYAVSCENGDNGENHTVSWEGVVYDLDFVEFWMMAYDFEFYPEDGDVGEELDFDFVGELSGHYYYISQERMEWHDGLNFTDEVEHDGTLHLVTINSEEKMFFS